MTSLDASEVGHTVPVEPPAPPISPPLAPSPDGDEALPATSPASPAVARPIERAPADVLFVPLAVTVGDGFKFGCGFFLALVLTLLAALVVVAALFAAVTVAGLTLPLARA